MSPPPFEQFFAYRRFFPVAEITPDGRRVLFVSNRSGQFNLWSVGIEGGEATQLTTFTDQAVRAVAIREDGTILFAADRDGDELHQLYRIPLAGGEPEQLTDLTQVQHQITSGAWAPDGKSFTFSANSRTPADQEIFVRREGDAEPRYLFGEGMAAYSIGWSPDGTKILAVEFRANTDFSLWAIDVASGEAVEATPHEGEIKYAPGPWKRDSSGFFVLSDEGREFSGLAFKPLDGPLEWIETPDREIEEVAGSQDGSVLAWIENDDGWARVRVRDLPEPQLPQGATSYFGSGLSLSSDGSRLAIVWERRHYFEVLLASRVETSGRSESAHFAVYDFIPQVIHSHPLFGLGLNTFSVYYEFVTGKTNWGPHSYWVSLIVESGLVGALLFLVFLRYVFLRLRAARALGRALDRAGDPLGARVRPLAWGMTAALAGTMAANFFYLTMQFYYFYGFVALAVALPVVFARRSLTSVT